MAIKPVDQLSWKRDADSKRRVRDAIAIREHLTEEQIDKTLKDSFPASDPPAWY